MQKYLATPTIIYNLIIHFYISCTSDQVHSVGFFMFSTPRIYTSHPILPSILCVKLVPAPTKCRHLEEMDRREARIRQYCRQHDYNLLHLSPSY